MPVQFKNTVFRRRHKYSSHMGKNKKSYTDSSDFTNEFTDDNTLADGGRRKSSTLMPVRKGTVFIDHSDSFQAPFAINESELEPQGEADAYLHDQRALHVNDPHALLNDTRYLQILAQTYFKDEDYFPDYYQQEDNHALLVELVLSIHAWQKQKHEQQEFQSVDDVDVYIKNRIFNPYKQNVVLGNDGNIKKVIDLAKLCDTALKRMKKALGKALNQTQKDRIQAKIDAYADLRTKLLRGTDCASAKLINFNRALAGSAKTITAHRDHWGVRFIADALKILFSVVTLGLGYGLLAHYAHKNGRNVFGSHAHGAGIHQQMQAIATVPAPKAKL